MLLDILEEHFDEASFLAERLRALAEDHGNSAGPTEEMDRRFRMHIEGLMLGGEATWELCKQRLLAPGIGDTIVVDALTSNRGA